MIDITSASMKILNNGQKMVIPKSITSCVANYILQHGYYWETHTTSLIDQNVKSGMIAVEVGAHIGYHSINIASHVGRSGKFWAFEANPDLAEIVQKNLEINNFSEFSTVIAKGVYSKSCKMPIHITKDKATSSLYVDLCPRNKELVEQKIEQDIEINCVSLDEFFDNQKIDFIKMDIEGAEADVIRGATNLLKNNNIQMIIEWWLDMPQHLSEEIFLDLLGSFGYKTFGIYPNNELKELKSYTDFTHSRYEDLYVARSMPN